MTEFEKNCYGMTESDIREEYMQSITSRFSGLEMVVMGIMSDCQEMLSSDNGGSYDFMVVEDVRQALNRAKWILFEYCDNR